MAIMYRVIIEPVKKENNFQITWHYPETYTESSFTQPIQDLAVDEMGCPWYQSWHRLEIGRKLFRFLDGDSRHLEKALAEANRQGEQLHLHLFTCKQTANWPFELLAQKDTFLLPFRLHLVRQVSDWGTEKKISPKNHPLKLLFMACSAIDIKPELDYEREEEAIFQVTENLAIDMDIEDSGTLEGLRSRLELEQFDVIHLSGHADIDKKGNPFFVMENEIGKHRMVYPGELWNNALIENPPRLLFLSGCRTGEAPESEAAVSFARVLVEKHNIPAVLGWGRPVADDQAIKAEEMIYHELSRGKSILEAVQRARCELAKEIENQTETYPAWPLLRLFSGGIPLKAIVKQGQPVRTKYQKMVPIYLENSRVRILKEGFIGRRRQLQQGLETIKNNFYKVGLLILGSGGLGKSCLAGKICQRLSENQLIIIHGKLNAISLQTAMRDAFIATQDRKGQQILSTRRNLTDKLADLCATSFKTKNYLLLFDDFEQNLEDADIGQPGPLMLEAAEILQPLLHYLPFSEKNTQLIITSHFNFTLPHNTQDMIEERLEKVWLTSFREPEIRKKVRELKNIAVCEVKERQEWLEAAGKGNPLLMEKIEGLGQEIHNEEMSRLKQSVQNLQKEFLHQFVLQELLNFGGVKLIQFLQKISIFRKGVQIEGIQLLAENAGITDWQSLLKKGMGLGLIEHDLARKEFRLTPLLRNKLHSQLKDTASTHKAAFTYYQALCAKDKIFNPAHVEEKIYHALGCSEEKTAARQGGLLVKHLREKLEFRKSLRIGQWILAEKKQKLSGEDDTFLLNETASTLHSLGESEAAAAYHQQALTIDRSLHGEYHPNTARDLNNLGTTWQSKGNSKKAGEYYTQAMEVVEKLQEEQDPVWKATLLNNLATSRYDMGDYSQAIESYEKTLEIWEKAFGEKHWHIADTFNNLGTAWSTSGEQEKAIDYYQQALSIYREIYGENHPDTAKVLNNLGTAWYQKEEYPKAIESFERAVLIWKNLYGETHPHLAAALNKLGQTWNMSGKPEKAKDILEPALSISKTVYGDKHSDTAAVLENLGTAYRFSGENEKALEFYKQALFINRSNQQISSLKNHTTTIAANLANLGKTFFAMDQKAKAKGYFQESYSIFKEIFGIEHDYTKAIADWLAKTENQ